MTYKIHSISRKVLHTSPTTLLRSSYPLLHISCSLALRWKFARCRCCPLARRCGDPARAFRDRYWCCSHRIWSIRLYHICKAYGVPVYVSWMNILRNAFVGTPAVTYFGSKISPNACSSRLPRGFLSPSWCGHEHAPSNLLRRSSRKCLYLDANGGS